MKKQISANRAATEDMLQQAINEITSLRQQNKILRAKQEMIDLFSTVLYTRPAPSEIAGMLHPDVVHLLQKELKSKL